MDDLLEFILMMEACRLEEARAELEDDEDDVDDDWDGEVSDRDGDDDR